MSEDGNNPPPSGGGGGGLSSGVIRILVFVGILVVLNVLSYTFDWGYTFY